MESPAMLSMPPVWPLLVVLAVALALVVALASGPRLFRGTTTVARSFWCRFRARSVDVDFQETIWDGRRTDVTRCSAFTPPTAVTCDKACLRERALPKQEVRRFDHGGVV